MIPVSVYHLIYKDPDCTKLAPSQKNGIHTYTTEKIPVIESCELFVIHPDTKCFQEVTFQVVSTEGSVIVSCATSICLNLIQIHSELNSSRPKCGKLIYSCADDLNKKQKCQAQVIVCSGKKSQEIQFKWPKQPAKEKWPNEPKIKYKKKNQVYMEEDQKNQVPICVDKNCQTSNMQLPKTVTEDCARTKPANPPDVTRSTLTLRRGRRCNPGCDQ